VVHGHTLPASVLVIDDDAHARAMLSRMLEENGHAVHGERGQQAPEGGLECGASGFVLKAGPPEELMAAPGCMPGSLPMLLT
jgi:response regulator RpfG family c-di-GMP phosphodiesterase